MKILHIADLHLGKELSGNSCLPISLLEDQRYILMDQILSIIKNKKVELLLISGDIFDRANVSVEYISLYDQFISSVISLGVKIFAISGNHDSKERISQHKQILEKGNYFVSGIYDGKIDKVSLEDEYGDYNIYLLPFITYHDVDQYFEDIEYIDEKKFNTALKTVIENEKIDTSKRNIILSHQLVLNSVRSPSEQTSLALNVSDEVSTSIYKDFDYVALGHIHKTMVKDNGRIVYPGAILPYHKDEDNKRYVSYVEIKEKGNLYQELILIHPKREIVRIKDNTENVLKHARDDKNFVVVYLTDDASKEDIESRLHILFPYLLSIDRVTTENKTTQSDYIYNQSLSPLLAIKDFVKTRLGDRCDDTYLDLIDKLYQMTIKDKNV